MTAALDQSPLSNSSRTKLAHEINSSRGVRSSIYSMFCFNGCIQTILLVCFIQRDVVLVARTFQGSYFFRDVYDGQLYRKHLDYLSKPVNFSQMINTDGVAVFQSSKASLWPVWVVINELPQRKRYRIIIYYFYASMVKFLYHMHDYGG